MVRRVVARRLPSFSLRRMAGDEDAGVRRIAAAHMLPDDAALMQADADWLVRLEAVMHAPLDAIAELVDDAEPDVREAVDHRLNGFCKRTRHD